METMEKINVRGAIKALEKNGAPLILPRPDYVPSMVRSTAGTLTADTGMKFRVEATEKEIKITRIT